jgi:hypothetical protein
LSVLMPPFMDDMTDPAKIAASAAGGVLSLPSESCMPWPEVGSGDIMFGAGAGRR